MDGSRKKIPLTERNQNKSGLANLFRSATKFVNEKKVKLLEDRNKQEQAWIRKSNDTWDY
jgi:hypothetical protein